MLDDLDQAVATLLKQELPPDVSSKLSISFNAPDMNFPPKTQPLPILNLYLYDLRENLEQRTNELQIERRLDGTAVQITPPVRVDCSYVVTAWTDPSSADAAAGEHALLGQAMAVLLAHPVLSSDVAKGSLQAANVPPPARALQPSNRPDTQRLIQMLGGRHKLSLNYTVTIEVPVAAPVTDPMVTDKYLKFQLIPGVKT